MNINQQTNPDSPERVVLTRANVQRLEAWMKEVTDLLLYQPDVPLEHKKCVVEAMVAFTKEIDAADKKRQDAEANDRQCT